MGQAWRGQGIPTDKLLVRSRLSELVPWTDREAVVAAVNPVADRFAKFVRNRAFVLDRQIGNAPRRVELVRCGEGVGGTDIKAARTGAAAISCDRVRAQVQGRVDLYN